MRSSWNFIIPARLRPRAQLAHNFALQPGCRGHGHTMPILRDRRSCNAWTMNCIKLRCPFNPFRAHWVWKNLESGKNYGWTMHWMIVVAWNQHGLCCRFGLVVWVFLVTLYFDWRKNTKKWLTWNTINTLKTYRQTDRQKYDKTNYDNFEVLLVENGMKLFGGMFFMV